MRNKKRIRIIEETVFEAVIVEVGENVEPEHFKCPVCEEVCALKYEMTAHGWDRHTNWFYVQCPVCETVYELSQRVLYSDDQSWLPN